MRQFVGQLPLITLKTRNFKSLSFSKFPNFSPFRSIISHLQYISKFSFSTGRNVKKLFFFFFKLFFFSFRSKIPKSNIVWAAAGNFCNGLVEKDL